MEFLQILIFFIIFCCAKRFGRIYESFIFCLGIFSCSYVCRLRRFR